MDKLKNQKGQALIELIVFLPLMFILYSMISGFANAINGSINQQKITRSFYYYRLQNNSTIPKPDGNVHQSWTKFGMYMFGWAESLVGDEPVMPCYKLSIPLGSNENDCINHTTPESQFIRVGTAYGVCGATYGNDSGKVFMFPDEGTSFQELIDESSCLIFD